MDTGGIKKAQLKILGCSKQLDYPSDKLKSKKNSRTCIDTFLLICEIELDKQQINKMLNLLTYKSNFISNYH